MNWTMSERIRAAVFVSLVGLMVGVPLFHLGGSGERFGWRMFSFGQALPQFTVVDDQGVSTAIDVEDFTANLRSDVAFVDALPPHLCRVVAGVSVVRVETQSAITEYSCQ